jgi:uncharacterized lipoprotein NlpE involved in copper resistance
MKKFFTLASLVALALCGCTNEHKGEANEKGAVNFDLTISNEVDDTRANVSCTTPATEDFTLKIEGVDHTFNAEYANIAAFNEDGYLHYGSYKATVTAGNIAEEGYDKATFVGSEEFEVVARHDSAITITATIANAIVKVETTENFRNYFVGGHTLELTTAAGNKFDVSAQSEPLFFAPGEFKVNGTAVKQANQSGAEGAVITLPEYKMESAAAQTFYTVKFDVKDAGQATLEITLNETLVESIDIEQELNDNAQ